MKRLLATAALAFLLIGTALATDGSMVCGMTGETVESCCCVVTADGAMVCSMTGETVTTCCCSPAS